MVHFFFMLINLWLIVRIEGINLNREEIIKGSPTYQSYQFNIYHHLSGISPYFQPNIDQLNPNLPEKCQIEKVAYLVRHGSVYVDDYDYYAIIKPFLKRLKKLGPIKPSKLSFLSKWTSPIRNEKDEIENLTKSGILESFELGIQLSYRYSKILSKENSSSFRIWAASSYRTKQTAVGIFEGLFPGHKINNQIISISEEKARGANSLTTTKTCQKFHSSTGAKEAKIWLQTYTKSILKRFNSYLKNNFFLPNDILAMQELCGYETVIRGSSPFCSLFTSDEWISFEYYFDLKYHYELGYGNQLSPYLGIHWIQSITDLLNKPLSSSDQSLYISVVHREMIFVVLVSLGLFNQTQLIGGKFPLKEINFQRSWKSSEIIPFLGRIQFERLTCSSTDLNQSFIRILLNSRPIPIPGCSHGPAFSCPFEKFRYYINQRYQTYRHFSKACQSDHKNTIDFLTFFHER